MQRGLGPGHLPRGRARSRTRVAWRLHTYPRGARSRSWSRAPAATAPGHRLLPASGDSVRVLLALAPPRVTLAW